MKAFILGKLEEELPAHLKYHSIDHVLDVFRAAEQYAGMEGVDDEGLLLLKTAALYHDSGFIVQAQDHEEISCTLARNHLPDFGFSDSQIETIEGMIRATKIPQTPHTHLEEILADADLDYLGRDDFEEISNLLFEELSLTDRNEWNKIQIDFFRNHKYFTRSAKGLRNHKKLANLKKIQSAVDFH